MLFKLFKFKKIKFTGKIITNNQKFAIAEIFGYHNIMRISYSSLDTYKTCPLKYKYQTIDKIKAPKGVEALFGSAVHDALNFMFQKSPLFPTIDQVMDYFRGSWEEQKTKIENEDELRNANLYLNQGISILEKFYKKNPPWNFNVVALESFFETEIEDKKTGGKYILSGIMDRIDKNDDDTYEIIDYKTGRTMPPQKEADKSLQLSIYHLGLVKRWPHIDPKKIKLSLYYLKHGEKITTARTADQLEATKEVVMSTIKEIEGRVKDNHNFPPTPSPLCDWCSYRKICPMWKHMYAKEFEKEKIKGQEELNGAIAEYFKLRDNNAENNDRMDELKNLVSVFMDENGVDRVFGNAGHITRKVTEKKSYDLDKIKEFIDPQVWNEILEPDEKKFEKVIPSLSDDIKEKISPLCSNKKVVTITASKKKGADEEKQ